MMDRNREARRAAAATSMVTTSTNGLSRRRHRSSSLRDSPDEDGAVELQESIRLRDRVKKERERDRDRERDREREREREREKERASRSKRRRAERLLMHNTNGGGGDDNTSEESVNVNDDDDDDDDDEDEEEENNNTHNHHSTQIITSGIGGGVRLLPPAAVGANNHLQHRKTFPPSTTSTKIFGTAPVWKSGDEMIGVSVPRKARSAATKRSHDWISSNNSIGGGNGGVGEQNHRQASESPVRQSLVPAPASAPPMSPSSSNPSVRKKLKPSNGLKPRPPKSTTKSSSSNPEELEIEIAEVLYGLKTQSQGPSKTEIASNDSKEANNRLNSDAKSRVSSPISSSYIAQPSSILPQNSTSSAAPLSAIAPKRKRPRQVSDNLGSSSVRSSPISSTKAEMNQTPKMEISTSNSSPSLTPGSAPLENGAVSYDLGSLVISQAPPKQPPEPMKVDPEAKPVAEEFAESKNFVAKEETISLPRKESPVVRQEEDNREDSATGTVSVSANKVNSVVAEVESPKEEKFQIDLMAPPPLLRPSPEREGEIDLGAAMEDQKPSVSRIDAPAMAKDREKEKVGKSEKDEVINVGAKEKKAKTTVLEEAESHKAVENKGRSIDLKLDLEKRERDTSMVVNKQVGSQKQQQQPPAVKATKEDPHAEKTGHSGPSPLPMSMASWPGGLPPMGYMAPLQGVVSMDGSTVPSAPIQMPLFSQPRPKRCATHCYIARNIHYLQQFMKMNPFWTAAAGSASLFGSKPCNLNVVPSADLQGNIAGRGVNNVQDKGQGLAIFPGHGGIEKGSQPANTADAGQRKQQILLQQALPTVAPNNIMHGSAFIFPLNQQQAAMAAASARPGSAKSSTIMAGAASANASNSAASSSATAGGVAPAMSFSYPNMPANETQYLAILQNNGYPFPVPAVGAASNYRGAHPQALPLFNGSFYSSQMIHPSQLQQQHPSVSQSQQVQQGHQNMGMSSASSSTQKHLQTQQQKPQSSTVNGGSGSGNLHNRASQQPQPPTNQHIPPPQLRHLENEVGGEDNPSTADSRGSQVPLNVYGQNFAMPMHHPNFALITPAATLVGGSSASGSGNQSDKKHQQSQQGLKTGIESLPHQSFAMSFGPINGATTTGFDLSSMAQNHAIFQNFQDSSRQKIQSMAAASAAQAGQQKKNSRISEDGKSGCGDPSSNADEERKGLAGKAPATAGQSIAFSRAELMDVAGSAIPANNVIESSARSLNLASSGSARTSRSSVPNTVGTGGVQNAQVHAQMQHQQQQFMQLHKQLQQQHQQQLAAAVAARSKTPATSNGNVYSDHLASSSSIAAKFPNAHSAFPQNLVQNSNSSSPAQSTQWKNSARTANSQNPSSLASSTTSSLKNLPQQPARTPQSHTQISFGSNQKSSAGSQGQQPPASHQSPSPPMAVGSPTSSMSKGASGSPRTTASASTSNKTSQAPSLSTQQAKNSLSHPSQKSSPVGSRNVPSILGNPHVAPTSSSGSKPQMQQQQPQQQQQLPKNMQQAQLFFSNPYVQAQSPHSTSTSSAASANSGYYLQRRRPDQQQLPQQPPGSSAASSSGMLSVCPVSLAGASTTDPSKAIAAAAAAASNMKGGGFPSQGFLHAAQFAAQSSGNQHSLMPAGFSYVHNVPAAVQVKPAEQKQPAGNDNLHGCWQPEKK